MVVECWVWMGWRGQRGFYIVIFFFFLRPVNTGPAKNRLQ